MSSTAVTTSPGKNPIATAIGPFALLSAVVTPATAAGSQTRTSSLLPTALSLHQEENERREEREARHEHGRGSRRPNVCGKRRDWHEHEREQRRPGPPQAQRRSGEQERRRHVLVAEARPDEGEDVARARRGRRPGRRSRRSAARARRSCRRLGARRTARSASVPTAIGSNPGTRSRSRAGTRPRVEQGETACDGQQERRVGEDGERVSAPGGHQYPPSPLLHPHCPEKAAGREEAGRERVVAQAVDPEWHEHDRRGGSEAARSDVAEQTPKRDEDDGCDADREEEVEVTGVEDDSRRRRRASARAP